ncbi:MAG TPA: hypothetical protein PKX25_14805, partial [Microthrixaceae bacterium]|nr:hypothetical protein [Microthrixaceae bacterium]
MNDVPDDPATEPAAHPAPAAERPTGGRPIPPPPGYGASATGAPGAQQASLAVGAVETRLA